MKPKVTFATSCWERDWRRLLLDRDYLALLQIGNHCFPFAERLLILNNVNDLDLLKRKAQEKVDSRVLSRYVVATDTLSDFGLQRSDFTDWQYYNMLGPLAAIREAKGDYLLYMTGDVYLKRPVNWIGKAIRCMEKNPRFKVANLTWNDNYREAQEESYRRTWNFFVADKGFSDQMFLVRTADFRGPIYDEIRADGAHYPRGDVWEKRVFSYMKNHGWERIIYKRGSYTHEHI